MSEPSMAQQIGVGLGLLVVDLTITAWLLWGYGWTGWADSFSQGIAPNAPTIAWRATWLLAGGAVVSGGGLLLRWRIPGIVQLVVLGVGAGLFACLAARE
jgi:hypothetical protein